jgi:hypothetical protein
MARPAKKRGFRPIKVANRSYRWKLTPGVSESLIHVTGAERKYPHLIVHLPDWRDPWHNLTGFHQEGTSLILHTSAHNDPSIITPAFVRAAILYAISNGWDTDSATAKPMQIRYSNGGFSAESEQTP